MLADQVGACTMARRPLHALIEAHVHMFLPPSGCTGTTPLWRSWSRGKARTGHIWTYARNERPVGGQAPPVGKSTGPNTATR
jgi:hypothetical protein